MLPAKLFSIVKRHIVTGFVSPLRRCLVHYSERGQSCRSLAQSTGILGWITYSHTSSDLCIRGWAGSASQVVRRRMLRPCIACGIPTRHTRCPDCQRDVNRVRDLERGSPTQRYGPGYQRRHRAVYGLPCVLMLPGCTGTATTADHTVPVAHGGVDSALQPACRSCNSTRGAR